MYSVWKINQPTYTSTNHNQIKGGPILNPIFANAQL